MSQQQVWVKLAGEIILARFKGDVTPAMLLERHTRICQIGRETGCTRVLLDDLEMHALSYEAMATQRTLNNELVSLGMKIAIVVPDGQLALRARLQFHQTNHRVFYHDIADAIIWLTRQPDSNAANAVTTE